MGKAKRKMRPQPPWWWILDNDNCWFCKNRNNLVSTKTRCRQCLRWEGREDAENAGKGRKANPGTAESGDDAEGGAGKVRSRARRHSQNRGRERSSTG